MPRLFIAVLPPEPVLDSIGQLDREDAAGVRWTERRHWHVTLRFFGEAEIVDAIAALSTLDAAHTEAVLGPKVVMLGRNIVSVPVAGLDDIAHAIRDVTAPVGEPPEPRAFTGHLTLARLNPRASCALVGSPFAARFPVDEVHLVESTVGLHGPTYESVYVKALTR